MEITDNELHKHFKTGIRLGYEASLSIMRDFPPERAIDILRSRITETENEILKLSDKELYHAETEKDYEQMKETPEEFNANLKL